MPLPYKKGSNGPEIRKWQDWAYRYAKSYAHLIGPKDAYFGNGEELFVLKMQGNLGLPLTGVFDELLAELTGFTPGSDVITAPVETRRKIWFYSNPGSGVNEFVGPSFEVGEFCKNVLKINHQPVKSAIGGYLGLLGGDSKTSYLEVIYDQYKSLEWLLDNNPDVQEAMQIRSLDPSARVEVELWFSGYSQKADGLEDALEILFGDGGFKIPLTGKVVGEGKYRILRDRINGVIQFGNPSKEDTGIARKIRPSWLKALIHNITRTNDFYADVPKLDQIRPAFYGIIVQAEMELPFFVHVLRVAVPVIMNFIPVLGFFGPIGQTVIAGMTGLNNFMPLLGNLMGQAGGPGDEEVDRKLIEMLSVTGLIQNVPGLIALVASLPGLQAHGEYHLPAPEFNGKTGIQVGNDIVAAFRR